MSRSQPPLQAFRSVVEHADEGVILTDGDGTICWANASAGRVLGAPSTQLIGRHGFDLCRPEQVSRAREEFARCLVHPGEPVPLAVDARVGDGEFRPVVLKLLNGLEDPDIRAVIIYVREGPTVGATATPDATVEEHEYRTLFENALVGLGVADLEGNLLAFNDAIRGPGGYTREDIARIGNVGRLYASGADRERILRIAREQGRVWREPVRFRRKDGSPYETLMTLTPVQFGGRRCWYATVEDVTSQKRAEAQREQLEAQLRQAQKMEAVGRMTSGIAHDFNNVLSIILVNAELMATSLPADALEFRPALEELHAAATRGAAMIQKLLGFSRNAPLSVVPTDLANLVESLRGMLRHLVPEHIELEIVSRGECTASVDPSAVEQMLLNLATNARDAMERGGQLRIEVQPVKLKPAELASREWMLPGNYACLTVSDTGTGMDEETLKRAFEPFFTTKPPGIGTGLGLPMVYGLVKQQRGFIDLRSSPGRGTAAHLYFPRVRAASRDTAPSPELAQLPPGGTETILVLEDDDSLREIARRVLERLGYHVLLAPDGIRGVAMYREHRNKIDLVISDIEMPGLNGPAAYEAMRRENPEVRFMLSSGYRETEPIGIEVPSHLTMLRKPWTIEEIARRVREMLERP